MRVASDTSSEYSRVASQNEYSFHSRVLASTRYSRVDVPLLEAGTVVRAQFIVEGTVYRLGEDEVLLDLPRCFKCRLVKQSRVYIVIGVTDVKDYTFNTI